VDSGEGGSDEELGDLEGGESSLDDVGDAVAERRDGVVGVLNDVSEGFLCVLKKLLTIMAWIPELTVANIQIGGDMKRIPAHMDNIAPAWWYFWRVVLRLPFARIMAVSRTS